MFISNKQLKNQINKSKTNNQPKKMGVCDVWVTVMRNDGTEFKYELEDMHTDTIYEEIGPYKEFNENGLRNKIKEFFDIWTPASRSQAILFLRIVDLLLLENGTHVCITILS